jgi:thioredoxin 1
MEKCKNHLMTFLLASLILVTGCQKKQTESIANAAVLAQKDKAKVTFVELGSVNCIPCKQMQPVMKAIEEKYGEQIKIVFYDVWQKDQKHFAIDYKIQLIPTQVFLDADGKEFYRHEGFFPEEEIHTLLQSRGLKTVN